jgi:hypothetical protein
MIEIVTVIISREQIVISAIGDGTVKEEYQRTRRATIKRVSGDFDTAGIGGQDGELADLLHDFIALGSTAREIQEQLNR